LYATDNSVFDDCGVIGIGRKTSSCFHCGQSSAFADERPGAPLQIDGCRCRDAWAGEWDEWRWQDR